MDYYNSSEAVSSFAAESATTQRRQQISSRPPRRCPRKGHKKSRRGCFNCKRRKIKVCILMRTRLLKPQNSALTIPRHQCPETYPSCSNCIKSNTKCEYPAEPQKVRDFVIGSKTISTTRESNRHWTDVDGEQV